MLPADTLLNRERLRFFVRQRDRVDRQEQRRLGLDSFSADWARLIRNTSPAGPAPRNRTIWMLWHQGEAQAPELVQHCISTWRRLNPDWEVRVLDKTTLPEVIDMRGYRTNRALHHMSDLIRLDLLCAQGGVWADATTLCLRPLDDWIGRAMTGGLFAFSRPQPTRSIASWFLAADTDSLLLQSLRHWCHVYLDARRAPESYFFFHHTFDWIIERSLTLRTLWRKSPYISARGPHILQRLLDHDLDGASRPTPGALQEIPLCKLNRKKGYTVDQIDRTMTEHGWPNLSELAGVGRAARRSS